MSVAVDVCTLCKCDDVKSFKFEQPKCQNYDVEFVFVLKALSLHLYIGIHLLLLPTLVGPSLTSICLHLFKSNRNKVAYEVLCRDLSFRMTASDPIMDAFSTLCAAHSSYQNNPEDRTLKSEQNGAQASEFDKNVENRAGSDEDDDDCDSAFQGFDQEGVCDTDLGFEVVLDRCNSAQNEDSDEENEPEFDSEEVPASFLLANSNLTKKQKKRVDKVRSKQVSKGEHYASNSSSQNANFQNDIKIKISNAATPCSNASSRRTEQQKILAKDEKIDASFNWASAKAAAQRACQPTSRLNVPSSSSSRFQNESGQKLRRKKANSHGNRSNFGGSEAGEAMRQFYESMGIDPDTGEGQYHIQMQNLMQMQLKKNLNEISG